MSAGATVAELRAAGAYPFGPMPEEQARAWAPTSSGRLTDAERAAVESAAALRGAQLQGDGSLLSGWALGGGAGQGGLVNASSNVAGAAGVLSTADLWGLRQRAIIALDGGARELRRKETRRERYRLRRAHQTLLDVKTKAGEMRYSLVEHEGELRWQKLARPITHVRLGQLLCGRTSGLALPGKGEKLGSSGRAERRAAVEVASKPDGSAGLRGIYYCGAVWQCAVCSAVIARRRGEELQRIYQHLTRPGVGPGLSAYFLTLTVRHSRSMGLEDTRRAVAEMWRKVRQSRAWRKWKRELGYFGDVRALEVTVSNRNGWHPHLHLVMWTYAPVPAELGERFVSWLRGAWRELARKHLGTAPTDEHGCQMEPVRSCAAYLAKLGVAAELTSSQTKDGRREGSRTPWQLLRDVAGHLERRIKPEEDPDAARDLALWREWVEGMHGARQLTWSGELRGVRRALGEPELSDAEVVAEEAERGVTVATVPADLWAYLDKNLPAFAPRVLEAAEKGGGQAVAFMVAELQAHFASGGCGPPRWWKETELKFWRARGWGPAWRH